MQLAPGAVEQAVAVLDRSPLTRQRFDRVAKLFTGFESSLGLELLSTVRWVLEHEKPQSQDELVAHGHGCNAHKTCFSPRQIALAVDVMAEKGRMPAIAP